MPDSDGMVNEIVELLRELEELHAQAGGWSQRIPEPERQAWMAKKDDLIRRIKELNEKHP